MAQMDDGVGKLQEFCGLLASTNSRVQEELSTLEAYGGEVGQIEDAIEETLGGFNDDLAARLKELADAEGAAVEEIGELASMAQSVADDRLEEARGDVEERDSGLEERLESDQGDLDTEFSEMTSAGFEALATTVNGVQTELTASGDRSEQAFDGLREALQTLEQQVQDAREEVAEALTQVADAVTGEETDGLESEASTSLTGWNDEIPNNVGAECDGLGEGLESLYEVFGSDAEAAGDELMESVSTAFQEAARFLAPEMSDPLEGALDRAGAEQLEGLGGDWQAANEVLMAGAATTETLEPIVEQLDISQRVVAEVDRALSALE